MSAMIIKSREANDLKLTAYHGHFATRHSHNSHYLDITRMKHECAMANIAAASLANHYVYEKEIDRLGHALHHNGLPVISGLEGERDVQLSGRFCRGVRIQDVPDHGSHLIVCTLHDRATSHFEDRFLLTFIHRFCLLSCVIRVPALCRTPHGKFERGRPAGE